MLKVFVYGTLKPGESNYQAYCGDRVLSAIPAWVIGKLFSLPLGYPALLWDQTGDWVQGYLLTFSTPEALHELDQLEEYQEHRSSKENAYQRRTIEVFTNSATLALGQDVSQDSSQPSDRSLASTTLVKTGTIAGVRPHNCSNSSIGNYIAQPIAKSANESLGMAWVYVMELEQIHQLGGTLLPNGYWTNG